MYLHWIIIVTTMIQVKTTITTIITEIVRIKTTQITAT